MNSEIVLIDKLRQDEQHSNSTDLLYMMAHDIKSPVNQIEGLLRIATSMNRDQALKEVLEMALESNARLNEKISQILSTSTTGDNDPKKIEFYNMLLSVQKSLLTLDGFKETKFITRIDPGVQCFANPVKLHSVLQNIIENAIKYQRRNVDKNIIVFSTQMVKNLVIIKISDNGVGIKKDIIDKIFDKHFTTGLDGESHGVGLYLVKATVNVLGGNIEVESKEGEGTTFTITLPQVFSSVYKAQA